MTTEHLSSRPEVSRSRPDDSAVPLSRVQPPYKGLDDWTDSPNEPLPAPRPVWLDVCLPLSLGAAVGSVLSTALVVVGVIG